MKPVYFTIGTVSMLPGAAGVVLLALPTTPSLLLSAWYFVKNSRYFHCQFISTALYKNHPDPLIQHRSMTWRTKLSPLVIASIMLSFAMYFMSNLWPRLFLPTLVLFKYYCFLFRIGAIRE